MGEMLFKTGNNGVTIDEMTVGINKNNMDAYKEGLKAKLLTETDQKLKDVSAIQTAIDAGWQGESRDKFLREFSGVINAISEDLKLEYHDLSLRLEELENNYFNQDKNMMNM